MSLVIHSRVLSDHVLFNAKQRTARDLINKCVRLPFRQNFPEGIIPNQTLYLSAQSWVPPSCHKSVCTKT